MTSALLQPLSLLCQPLHKQPPAWNLEEMSGRLVEISEPRPIASLSFAFLLVHEAQVAHQYVAWVGTLNSIFYPPDAKRNGADLDNLPVFRMAKAQHTGRVAEILLQSGAFRLVIIDLEDGYRLSLARLSQLNALARKYHACVLFLATKQLSEPSLGPLISVRARTSRKRLGDNEFLCEIHVFRDKRRGSEWTWSTRFEGVEGYY